VGLPTGSSCQEEPAEPAKGIVADGIGKFSDVTADVTGIPNTTDGTVPLTTTPSMSTVPCPESRNRISR
jgi:hypothetical protein